MNDHPSLQDIPYERWRHIKTGGDIFVTNYLKQRPKELSGNFSDRRDMTPDPATASSALDDVINSFAARMDVVRSGGSKEYQDAISGKQGGVDKQDTDLQTFILKETLPELCYMSKFAWIVQNFTNPSDPRKFPYLIPLRAEKIRNWTYVNNTLVSLLIKDTASVIDPTTGFSTEEKPIQRVFKLLDNGTVETKLLDDTDVEIDPITLLPGSSTDIINIDEIPVVIMELPNPLLKKIDKFQIAILNMESADIDWLRTASLPLYTEQSPGLIGLGNITKSADPTADEDQVDMVLGGSRGRQYPMGADRPDFIAPPADPIRASMEKQAQMAARTRDILKTNLTEMKLPSAESLDMIGQGMEAGLYIIGIILYIAEINFARIFHKYQGTENTATAAYPKKYELRTEADRLKKAESLQTVQQQVGSNIAKKYLELQIIDTLLEGKMPREDYEKMQQEVLNSKFCIYDPETIQNLVNSGILSKELASATLGAPAGDSKTATQEHIARIQAIKVSQTSGLGDVNPDPQFTEDIKKEDSDEVRNVGGS